MKRTVRGSLNAPPVATTRPPLNWQIMLAVALSVLISATVIAQRSVARSGEPFLRVWLIWLALMALPGAVALIGPLARLLIGATVVGGLLLDAGGWPLGIWGHLLWLMGAFWMLVLVLSVSAEYITPSLNIEFNQTSWPGLRLLLRYAATEWRINKPFQVTPGRLPKSFSLIGAGPIPGHQAISVFEGDKFVGILGPGYKSIEPATQIGHLVDLRPQSRTRPFVVTTRDGIRLEGELTVRFRIRPPQQVTDAIPFPYDPNAVRDFVYADTAFRRDMLVGGYERVAPVAEIRLAERVGRHSLDELYQVNALGSNPLTHLAQQVKGDVSADFKNKGLQIDILSLTPLRLPPAVADARFRQWEKGWKAAIEANKIGKGIKPLDQTGAAHQMEVLDELHQSIQTLRQSGRHPYIHAIADRLEQTVAIAATEGLLRSLIPLPKPEKPEGGKTE
jgi:hypothetical protein